MFKNLTWPIVLVIISVIFTVGVVFTGIILMEIDKVTSAKAVTVEVNSEEVETGIEIETATKEADFYETMVSYPITHVKKVDQQVENWVTDKEKEFSRAMAEKLEETDFPEDEVNNLIIDTYHFKADDDLHSFLLRGEVTEDNKEAGLFDYTITVDMDGNRAVSLADILSMDDEAKDIILDHAKELDSIEQLDEDKLKSALSDTDSLNWALTDENLLLFFQKNEIGNEKDMVELEVPFVDLHEAMTEEYYSVFITEEMQKEIDNAPRDLDPTGKYVAVTFDDGPHETVTPRILDILDDYDAKATFYMLGKNAVTYPHIAQMVNDEGHEIANHSITHANLNAINGQKIEEEVTVSQQQIEEATGVKAKTFRPPYGEYNDIVLNNAKETEQIVTMWTIDTLDWQSKNTNAILQKVQGIEPGGIILMHDIHPTTADALPQVLEYLQDQGYEFVTVSEMLQLDEHIEVGPYYGSENEYNEQAF